MGKTKKYTIKPQTETFQYLSSAVSAVFWVGAGADGVVAVEN